MNPERLKIEEDDIKKKEAQPTQGRLDPSIDPHLLTEEIQSGKVKDERQIKQVRTSIDLENQEVAGNINYDRADNFEEGIHLLRDRIKKILTKKEGILVSLSGKTASGKTSLANELCQAMTEQDGINATVVSTDDFYLPNSDKLDLKKLHETINKLRKGERVGRLVPAKVIIIEGLQTIEDETVGQKPDIRAYVASPAYKRFANRLLRDGRVGFRSIKDSLKKLAELGPETLISVKKFEADSPMEGVDILVNNNRESQSEPELYISDKTLIFSGPGGISESVEIAPDKVPFLEQLGILRK